MNRDAEGIKDSGELIYGVRPVMEAVTAGKEISRVLIQNGLRSDGFRELIFLLKDGEIPYSYVPVVKLNRVTRKNHQGIIAYVSPVVFQNIEDIIPRLFEEGKTPLILLMDKLTDVRNFGAILRTAESAGVHAVIFPAQGSAPLNSGTVKSSAGAIFNIPLCRSYNLKDMIYYLQASGLKVIAATEKSSELYTDSDMTGPLAIVMGSEDTGVSDAYLKLCDSRLRIPMNGETASLNVSVAAGVILFEALRQRSNL